MTTENTGEEKAAELAVSESVLPTEEAIDSDHSATDEDADDNSPGNAHDALGAGAGGEESDVGGKNVEGGATAQAEGFPSNSSATGIKASIFLEDEEVPLTFPQRVRTFGETAGY